MSEPIRIIAMDFDGTIVENRWPDIGPLIPRAKRLLDRFVRSGGKVIIWTCREGESLKAAKQFLDSHKIPYHAINEHLPEQIEKYGNDPRKIGAQMYIDDMANAGIDWIAIENKLFN